MVYITYKGLKKTNLKDAIKDYNRRLRENDWTLPK